MAEWSKAIDSNISIDVDVIYSLRRHRFKSDSRRSFCFCACLRVSVTLNLCLLVEGANPNSSCCRFIFAPCGSTGSPSWCVDFCSSVAPGGCISGRGFSWWRGVRRGVVGGARVIQNLGKSIHEPQFRSTLLSSIHHGRTCDVATGHFDGAGATEGLSLAQVPSPRSRRSCIKKPHRRGTSKPPLRQSAVLVLVTSLAQSNYEG